MLAMHHGLCGISTHRLSSLRKGDEHPAYSPLRSMAPFTFSLPFLMPVRVVSHSGLADCVKSLVVETL